MLSVYRWLLRLYPTAYRTEYDDEMIVVFRDARRDAQQESIVARFLFCAREVAGLVRGAMQEHVRATIGVRAGALVPMRRFTMRAEFRFPKTTAVLMTVILAGVVLTIEKATAIRNSVPDTHAHVGPIQPEHFTFFPALAVMFLAVYAAAGIGWAILFALHRAGVHRMAEIEAGEQK